MDSNAHYSIVTPVYNEAEGLETLYSRLSIAAITWGRPYEVIVVNDGSTDDTHKILLNISKRDSKWKIVNLSRNFGHQMAISAGLSYASGEVIAVMDSDLQDPPEVLPEFFEKLENADVVYAIRKNRKEGFIKRLCYSLFYRLLKSIASIDIPLDSGDFCVMNRRVLNRLNSLPERQRFVRGLRAWLGFKQIGHEYERASRDFGQPKYNLRKLAALAIDGLLSFSHFPLRILSFVGLALCGLAISSAAFVTAWWVFEFKIGSMSPHQVLGWTSLMITILFLSGLQFLFMGIIGEYVGTIFQEVKNRPSWVVESTTGIQVAHEIHNSQTTSAKKISLA
ncbi:MAG: glycosyltransferase family 2 protein [Bdellovibrionales bacterium]|nr:glycosyltransferase family 2 protein [Bdellovibrionales bacterium]